MPRDPFSENKGHFKKGYDPRRHTFTTEECRAGFQALKDKIRENIFEDTGVEPDPHDVFCSASRILIKSMRYREI